MILLVLSRKLIPDLQIRKNGSSSSSSGSSSSKEEKSSIPPNARYTFSGVLVVRKFEMFLEVSSDVEPMGAVKAGHLVRHAVNQTHVVL